MNGIRVSDYFPLTEIPGLKATQEQLERLYHRYRFAFGYLNGKEVLEVACGSGIGLGLLAKKASRVVGGDIDEKNLEVARSLYGNRINYFSNKREIEIIHMDAHELKFSDKSFGLVLLYEAIYYLRHPQLFVAEAKRVLLGGGTLIICTVNKDWKDFHPSPNTHRYFSVPELYSLLKKEFPVVEIFGAFPVKTVGLLDRCVSFIKRLAIQMDLIPGSLTARAYLKRLFLGPLKPIPDQIDENMGLYLPPVPIPRDQPNRDYKIIYAVARKDQS